MTAIPPGTLGHPATAPVEGAEVTTAREGEQRTQHPALAIEWLRQQRREDPHVNGVVHRPIGS